MKQLILLITFIIPGCTISQGTIDRQVIAGARTAAIAPFTSTVKLESAVLTESQEVFRSTLSRYGFIVIDQEKVDGLLKLQEFSTSGINRDNITSAGRILGVDAIMTGEITIHEEKQRVISPHGTGRFGLIIMDNDHEKSEYKTYLRFKITVTLINARDGRTILTMTNRFVEAEKDENMPGYIDINAYRRLTLKKMGQELFDML